MVYTLVMGKTYHFMAGLPRSGSTVLSAILNQNPDVYSSPQTDLLGVLYDLESKIPTYEGYRAGLLFSSYDNVMKQIPNNFYSPIDKSTIIDKNRGWGTPYNWNNLSPYLNEKGKVILTMRPILEVLASFVRVNKETEKVTSQLTHLNSNLWVSDYRDPIDAMADNLMIPNGEIDRAIFSVANLLKNHGDQVYVVWYDDLIKFPQNTLNGIYDFLELDRYDHDFNNIVAVDKHDDLSGYGLIGLHDVKKKLEKSKTNPEDYLSEYAIQKYQNALDFLNDFI
jgi:sulfotransferase